MEFFRKHYKTMVWILIGCFLLYLIPTSIFVVQNSPPTSAPGQAPVNPGF